MDVYIFNDMLVGFIYLNRLAESGLCGQYHTTTFSDYSMVIKESMSKVIILCKIIIPEIQIYTIIE